MPGFTAASSITSSASPSRSRASSVEKVSPTIGATSRFARGNCGSDGCAWHPASAAALTTATQANLFNVFDLDGLAGDPLREGGGHEAVKVAIEHVARAGRGYPGAQVFDQLVGLQH